jgi:signal transduction histidine kinase/ActR/RegA family two-component response regulator
VSQPDPTTPPVETFDELYEHAPCGYLTASPSGTILRANGTILEWLGQPREAVVGQRLQALLTAGSRIMFDAHCAPVLNAGGKVTEVSLDLRLPAGGKLPTLMDFKSLQGPDGAALGFRIVVVNTTDRRAYENELIRERERAQATALALRDLNETLERRVEERSKLLQDTADFARLALSAVGGVGVWTYDVALDRFFCDDNIAELYSLPLGRGAEGFLRGEFLAHLHPEDAAALAETMERGLFVEGDLELEYRIRHADGSIRWVLSRGNTYFEDGQPVRRTGIGVDMTRQRTLEEQFRQSQKMEAVGQLTGGVAHDFNNLRTVIRGSVDLLRRPDISEDRRARYVDAIANTADRAAKLTAQLLAFARRQALKPVVFDVAASVNKIADMVRTLAGPRVEIVTQAPFDACLIDADPSQFDTTLVNLAINARDAMGGEGELTISVAKVAGVPAARERSRVSGPFIAIGVTDTGCGIEPANLERIFEPFFTTKEVGKGTGLGLSQVFGFARQSGGEIVVRSTVGKGTTFTLYLPEARTSVDEGVDAEPDQLVDGHGLCVLVVEDNADVGRFATQALSELGYATVWASDGRSALAELAQDAERFDIVFTDVLMPGMTGIELGQQIRGVYPNLPVILTSGYSHILAQNSNYGFDLLQKPYSLDDLSRTLRKTNKRWRVHRISS